MHGCNGAWGCLALGLFGDGWNGVAGPVKGLFYGDASQFLAERVGVLAKVVYVGSIALIVFKLTGVLVGNRVDKAAETEGLDLPEMGVPGYVGIEIAREEIG